jgi:hypothetical protein
VTALDAYKQREIALGEACVIVTKCLTVCDFPDGYNALVGVLMYLEPRFLHANMLNSLFIRFPSLGEE